MRSIYCARSDVARLTALRFGSPLVATNRLLVSATKVRFIMGVLLTSHEEIFHSFAPRTRSSHSRRAPRSNQKGGGRPIRNQSRHCAQLSHAGDAQTEREQLGASLGEV